MSQHKRIFIVGHMGSGKSVVANLLANKLGWQLLDADFGLEHRMGRSSQEVLGKAGEESFRQHEAEVLSQLLNREKIIVITDGGVISAEKNRKLLSAEFTIYLKASTPVQLERMAKSPFTLTSDSAASKALLDKLHKERDAFYDDVAKLTIDTDSTTNVEHDVEKILKALEA